MKIRIPGKNVAQELRRVKHNVGRYVLGSILGANEPQRAYMWEVLFYDGVEQFTETDAIRFYAKSITIPRMTNDVITHAYMGKRLYYSGKDASDHTITITFWDDEELTVYNYLRDWYKLTSEPWTGSAVSKERYVRSIEIRLKDASDTWDNKKIQLFNVFVSDIADVQLSYDSSELIEITATFVFDERLDDGERPRSGDSEIGTVLQRAKNLFTGGFTG